MTRLVIADSLGYADLVSLVGRARRASSGGAVRLHARGRVLGVYVEILPGHALFADGAVVGVRGVQLAVPADLDVTVASAALAERFAHDATGPVLAVPPGTVSAPWAGALPDPGESWQPLGEIPAQALEDAAVAGIAAIAALASGPSSALDAERDRVWSAPTGTDPEVPAGVAFGCRVLGFLAQDEAVQVYRRGRWLRVRTGRGHVLAR
ncbi:MAG: hypothetical protein ACOYBY_06000 [Dermatophilaceae bacterium]